MGVAREGGGRRRRRGSTCLIYIYINKYIKIYLCMCVYIREMWQRCPPSAENSLLTPISAVFPVISGRSHQEPS